MIENEERLIVVENRVVMSQTAIVPNVVERLQRRDARLQNSQRHLRLYEATSLNALDVLAKEAVKRLLFGYDQAALHAEYPNVLDHECVQPVEAGLRFVPPDCIPYGAGDRFEILLVGYSGQSFQFGDGLALQQPRDNPLALFSKRSGQLQFFRLLLCIEVTRNLVLVLDLLLMVDEAPRSFPTT